MSDHFICLIPEVPDFIPSKESQAVAAVLVQKACSSISQVTLETDRNIVFRDCGENFESIHCPHCSTEMDVEHWHALIDQDYSDINGFHLRELPMACCGQVSTLNDLCYKWPMGFSRFVLRFRDQGGELPDTLLIELESTLGTKLRVIYQYQSSFGFFALYCLAISLAAGCSLYSS